MGLTSIDSGGMKYLLECTKNIDILQSEVTSFIVENDSICGIVTHAANARLKADVMLPYVKSGYDRLPIGCGAGVNSVFDDWGTAKTNTFMEIMRQHPNLILFHGHSHMKLECQEYDENANYTERNGFKSVHVPSLARPRTINLTEGTTPEVDSESQGYIVDVYDDCIVLIGMDLIGNKPVPLGVYKIDTA